MAATTARERGKQARLGLSHEGVIDHATHALLLRQLYLSHYALRQFARAYELALQAAELGVLSDVVHQDAARAKQALGDVEGAIGHLRMAARLGPPSRRAFHWWTLGAVLYLAGRHDDAIAALSRAARWGTTDKPLYQGHLTLAKCAAGRPVRGIGAVIERLEQCPSGEGYGRFVLGQLAYESEQFEVAREHLEAFVKRTSTGRTAMRIALEGELRLAKITLGRLTRTA